MKIETIRFGTIEFDERSVITFPEGLIGFAGSKRYVLLGQGESQAVAWLQSLDAPDVALPVVSAHVFPTIYPDVSLPEAAAMGGLDARADDLAILAVLVAVPDQPPTVNLLAPIIIDTANRSGAQVFLQGSRFSTRELLVMGLDSAPHKHEAAQA